MGTTGTIALVLEQNFPHIAREAARSAAPEKGRRRPADPDLVFPTDLVVARELAAVPPRRRVRGDRPG